VAFLAACKDDGAHRSSESDAMDIDLGLQTLDGVVDKETRVHFASRRVRVDVNGLFFTLLNKEHYAFYEFTC